MSVSMWQDRPSIQPKKQSGDEEIVANPGSDSQTAQLHSLFEQAVALLRQNDHNGVIKLLDQILKQVPEQPQVLNMYALSLAELGDMAKAVQMLEKAITGNPDFADSWVNLGVVQQKFGNHGHRVVSGFPD